MRPAGPGGALGSQRPAAAAHVLPAGEALFTWVPSFAGADPEVVVSSMLMQREALACCVRNDRSGCVGDLGGGGLGSSARSLASEFLVLPSFPWDSAELVELS